MAFNVAINNDGLITATHGTIFIADAASGEVAMPTDLSKLTLLAQSIENKWFNIGHTSKDNKLSIETDGGESESKSTWLVSNAKTTYSAVTLKVKGKSVQGDKNTLKFVYNGWDNTVGKGVNVSTDKTAQKVSMIILAQDEGSNLKFGIYAPNVDFTYDGFPDFSGDNFVEFGFSANVLSSQTLNASENGKTAVFTLLSPEDFKVTSSSVHS